MPEEPSLKDVLTRLETALTSEKKALLSGDYKSLEGFVKEKEILATRLDRMLVEQESAVQLSVYRQRLKAVASAAAENETLLKAAKTGACLARTRLQEILSRQRTVGVYGETGEKLLTPDAGTMRQRFA